MHRLLMIGILLAGSLWSVPARAQVLSIDDLRDDKQGMPGEQQLQRVIEIGAGTRLPASVHVTNKGNGVLAIANLRLKVVDNHGDGATYQNGMPHVEFADVDGDGWKDLLVTGIVDYTDDKSDKVRKQESFTFLYRFDPRSKSFRQTYKRASFALEEGPHADPRLMR